MFGNSFPTHAQTTLFWWPMLGFRVSSLTCSFSEEPLWAGKSLWQHLRNSVTWPGSLSGLFPRPHCQLCPSSYHPSGWGSHFLTSFQMMTREINIVQAWVRHLRHIRVSATWKFPWRIRELWDGPDHKGIHPQQDNLHAPCQARITLSKAEPIVPWPLPPQQNCKVESSACLPYHVHFFFFPSGLI